MAIEIDSYAAELLTFVTTYLLHSTLLLGLAWAVLRLARIRSWALRERVWKLAAVLPFFTSLAPLPPSMSPTIVSLKFLCASDTPVASAAVISSIAPATLPPRPTTVSVPLPASIETTETDHKFDGLEDAKIVRVAPLDPGSKGIPRAIRWPADAAASVDIPGRSRPRSLLLLSASALLMAFPFGGLLRMVCQSIAFRRRLRGCQPIESGRARDLLTRVLRNTRVERPIRLLASSRATQPAAFGLFRWTIVLPGELIPSLKPDELEALLTHEAAHLIRGDAVWLYIGRILCGSFAFQPLNFVARQNWRMAAEFLCDQWAVRNAANRFALARCLAQVAEWSDVFPHRVAALLAIGSRSKLSQRIETLISDVPRTDAWDTGRRRRMMSLGALLTALAFVSLAPRTRLLAETDRDTNRTDSISVGADESLVESRHEPAATEESALRIELALLDAELAQLNAAIKRVDELLMERGLQNPALQGAAKSIAARSASLVDRHRRLTELISAMSSPPQTKLFDAESDGGGFSRPDRKKGF